MNKIKKCAICGKEFETTKPNKKYCSLSCKEAGKRLQRMKWEHENPDYNREYMREYMREHRKTQKGAKNGR